ncbi:MAG: prepilin-type N-terminal cleavage/methylation domain-containing protein [Candidatus Omnitrophica bacterium]|nr:prepilin-type N-terminal cleavage/methylation domain-containing protein [Candidatus Omnitrophota bacterium]
MTRCQRGLTLIEVLGAIVLIAIAGVGSLQALAAISRAIQTAESRVIAYQFASSKFGDLQVTFFEKRSFDISEEGSFRQGGIEYRWFARAEEVEEGTSLGQLSVGVDWGAGRGAGNYGITMFLLQRPEEAAGE